MVAPPKQLVNQELTTVPVSSTTESFSQSAERMPPALAVTPPEPMVTPGAEIPPGPTVTPGAVTPPETFLVSEEELSSLSACWGAGESVCAGACWELPVLMGASCGLASTHAVQAANPKLATARAAIAVRVRMVFMAAPW